MSLANKLTTSSKLAASILPFTARETLAVLTGSVSPIVPATAVIVNSAGYEQVGLLSYYLDSPANAGSTDTIIGFTGGDGTEVLACGSTRPENGCVLTKIPALSTVAITVGYGTAFDLTTGNLFIYWTPLTPQS